MKIKIEDKSDNCAPYHYEAKAVEMPITLIIGHGTTPHLAVIGLLLGLLNATKKGDIDDFADITNLEFGDIEYVT